MRSLPTYPFPCYPECPIGRSRCATAERTVVDFTALRSGAAALKLSDEPGGRTTAGSGGSPRKKCALFFLSTIDIEASDISPDTSAAEADRDRRVQISEARALLERSRRLLEKMTPEDREEAIALHEQIEEAFKTAQWQPLHAAMTTLADLLFYVEEG